MKHSAVAVTIPDGQRQGSLNRKTGFAVNSGTLFRSKGFITKRECYSREEAAYRSPKSLLAIRLTED